MIKKILEGYIEKLYNLIRDEIREFVEYSLEPVDGTTNDYFISLSINTNKPKQYKIEVDDDEIKITDVSTEKTKNINEEELIKEFEEVAKKYKKLCASSEIPPINPAIKKLLEVAKKTKNKLPLEVRWLTKITEEKNRIILIFPQNLFEIQKETPKGEYIMDFSKNGTISILFYGESCEKLRRKDYDEKEGKEKLMEFLKDLVKKL